MMCPNDLPQWIKSKTGADVCLVTHRFDEDDDPDDHDFGDCTCLPSMTQVLGTGSSYTWVVVHGRLPLSA